MYNGREGVFEVLQVICVSRGYSLDGLAAMTAKAVDRRGGFVNRVFLVCAEGNQNE